MKVQKLFIPGQFDDCFLYRGRAVLFQQSGSIAFLDLAKISTYLEHIYPQTVPMTSMLFLRNDWAGSPFFENQIKNSEFVFLYLKALANLTDTVIEIHPKQFIEKEHKNELDYSLMLDCTIYNGNLYVGTECGFFSAGMDWNKLDSKPAFNKRHDGPAIDTNARFGAINFSGGDDGLFTSIGEFARHEPGAATFRKIADRSTRSDWCQFSLVNYPEASRSVLYATEQKKATETLEADNLVVTKIDQHQGLEYIKRSTERPRTQMDWDNTRYVFNANQTFYAHQNDGQLYRIKVIYPKHETLPLVSSVSRVREFETAKILSTNSVGENSFVETFDKLYLIHKKGIITALDKQLASVRTYPKSRQYKQLATAVSDEGAWLLSVFDESILEDALNPDNKKRPKKRKRDEADEFDELSNDEDDDGYI